MATAAACHRTWKRGSRETNRYTSVVTISTPVTVMGVDRERREAAAWGMVSAWLREQGWLRGSGGIEDSDEPLLCPRCVLVIAEPAWLTIAPRGPEPGQDEVGARDEGEWALW